MELMFAAFMLLVAATVCLVFLRPAPVYNGVGAVKEKIYKPAGTYWQYQAGDRQGFKTPTPIAIAECYTLTIQSDTLPSFVYIDVNTVEVRQYEIGTRVKFEYCVRGLPLLWSRVYVLSVSPAGADGDNIQV